jgi:quinoprotein glucose dehydrogenase
METPLSVAPTRLLVPGATLRRRSALAPGNPQDARWAMADGRRSLVLLATGIVVALMGLALAAGGAWLIALGGSWYYLVAGPGLIVAGVLLMAGRPASLWVYALVAAGTLGWALWEVVLDWWPLAARGDVIVLVGLFLLTPWVRRALGRAHARHAAQGGAPMPVPAFRGGGLVSATLAATLVVAVVSWFVAPNRIEGSAPGARAEVPGDALGVPPGEWHAYGRADHGQRYSPLAQITPENVVRLQVAWTYHTGDVRGRPGDPEETTFEVTPLKIGNRLFLCTPHQFVIALDATTGAEIWRYDPKILDELALQHLTCRGLSYHPGPEATIPAAAPEAASGRMDARQAAARSAVPNLPGAAENADRTEDCTARLFMPTADGRLITLSPETGAVCRNFGGGTGQINLWANMPNVKPGAYYSTSPPAVAGNLVIVGGTVLDNVSIHEQSGVIRAYDAGTGELVWNWDSGNPDATAPMLPGETYTLNSPNS